MMPTATRMAKRLEEPNHHAIYSEIKFGKILDLFQIKCIKKTRETLNLIKNKIIILPCTNFS